ncbi:hypothetical protein C2S51_014699 [Perilla frutescens var. frutescens]|nr:hypothetical protein C2S51_014699 [Perilla frutescens var. frutescens]
MGTATPTRLGSGQPTPSTPVDDVPVSNQMSSHQSSSVVPSGVLETGEPSSRMMIWPNRNEPWIMWKEVTIEHRMMWFEDFKTKCKWDEHDHDDIVHIWRQKSAKETIGRWLVWKKVLAALKERWRSNPKFKKLSEQNKKKGRVNRDGAISITERRMRLAKEFGRTVSIPEVFQKINFDEKKDKWLATEAENVYHTYKKMKEDSTSKGKNVDDSTIFLEASGGKKNGRAYGFGSEVAFHGF